MFELTVYTKNNDLHTYLTKELIRKDDITYEYFSLQHVATILASYIIDSIFYAQLKATFSHELTKAFRKRALSKIPIEEKDELLSSIRSKLSLNLKKSTVYRHETFITFQIRHEKQIVTRLIDSIREDRTVEMKNPIFSPAIKESTPTMRTLSITSDGKMSLKDSNRMFILRNEKRQLDVISYVIYENPRLLKVQDPHRLLNNEFAIILKKSFKSKVIFE